MKKRVGAFAALIGCLVIGGLVIGISRGASKSGRTNESLIAAPAGEVVQQCAQCEQTCKGWFDKCKEGGQYACYKAAACLCKCNLDAGGCGSSKEALKECYEKNEKLARELGSTE